MQPFCAHQDDLDRALHSCCEGAQGDGKLNQQRPVPCSVSRSTGQHPVPLRCLRCCTCGTLLLWAAAASGVGRVARPTHAPTAFRGEGSRGNGDSDSITPAEVVHLNSTPYLNIWAGYGHVQVQYDFWRPILLFFLIN